MAVDPVIPEPAGSLWADAVAVVTAALFDFDAIRGSDHMNAVIAETGAVVMGKRSFEMADDPDSYVGNYEFQVPIFVLTHHPPRVMPRQDNT